MRRRDVLKGAFAGGLGLATAAIIGCDDDDDDDDDATTPGAAATTPATETAEPEAEVPEAVRLMNEQAERDGSRYPYAYADPPGEPKEGGVLKVAVSWQVGTFDLTKSQAGGSVSVPDTTYNRLLGFVHGPEAIKFERVLEPELAQDWEQSPDGLEHTFNLAQGVKFHNVPPLDGRDFTAEDVLFAYQRQSSEGVGTAPFGLVENMEVVDDHTFRMTLSKPSPDFLFPFAERWMSIYPRELVDEGIIDTAAIGTGPLIVREIEAGSHVILDTNPDYWEPNRHGRGPWLDGLEFRIMSDIEARRGQFRAGQVEFAFRIPSTPQEAEVLLSTNPDIVVLADPILSNGRAVGFNNTTPKFQDDRVRGALSLGLDREQNVQVLYDGIGTYMPGAAWPFVFDQTPTGDQLGPWWRYDPDEAVKLLQAAGQENLQFRLFMAPENDPRNELELMQEQWRGIGVTVDLDQVGYTEFNAKWVQADYDEAAAGFGASGGADGSYHSDVHSQSPVNRWHIDDPQIDEWADAQRVELDPVARRELHTNIWFRLLEKAYRIELAITFSLSAYQPSLRFVRYAGAFGSYHWFNRWGDPFPDVWIDET